MRRFRTRHVMPITSAVLACSAPQEPPPGALDQPLRTDRLEYEVRSTGYGLEVEIPFRYRNMTGDTVYVVNCNGIAPPSLEKRVDGEWVPAWSAVVPLCLSPPIVIPPAASYTDTLRVAAGLPSDDRYPKFAVDEVEGTYRLVWNGVVHDYEDDRPGFGEPLPLEERVSNPFTLTR